MKARSSHPQEGPADKARPGPTPIQAELTAQRAALDRLMESGEVLKARRLQRAVYRKAKASSQAPAPKPPTRSKSKSRSRKTVLAAYKAKRGIE